MTFGVGVLCLELEAQIIHIITYNLYGVLIANCVFAVGSALILRKSQLASSVMKLLELTVWVMLVAGFAGISNVSTLVSMIVNTLVSAIIRRFFVQSDEPAKNQKLLILLNAALVFTTFGNLIQASIQDSDVCDGCNDALRISSIALAFGSIIYELWFRAVLKYLSQTSTQLEWFFKVFQNNDQNIDIDLLDHIVYGPTRIVLLVALNETFKE